jgi:oxygen-dependent protoporphyrinogen oxidase
MEASARAGGMIQSQRRDDYLLELGPQSFTGTAALRALCEALGIAGELLEAPPRAPRYVLVKGVLQALPLNPVALAVSPLLGAASKWKIARDAFTRTRPPDEDESVADFARRKFSADLLENFLGPFISGIYAGDPERLSLRSTFPQVYEAEKSAGSILRGLARASRRRKQPREPRTLLTFREGNETLPRALERQLGKALRPNAEILGMDLRREAAKNYYQVRWRGEQGEEILAADHVILATPTDVSGKLLGHIESRLERLLGAMEYAPVAVVSLGYKREDIGHRLDGFGFLIPRVAGIRVLGTVWNSSLFAERAPEGYVLLTSFVGGATDPAATALSAEEIVALVHGEIAPLLTIRRPPAFSAAQVYRRALPQYNLGHAARLAEIETLRRALPNLWLTGNYLRGPAIGACIEQSLAVADEVRGCFPT